MSKRQKLIDEANKGKNIQEIVYGNFPVEIYKNCGPEEVQDILGRLDQLSIEKEKIEDWDGDSQDDIWRVQSGFSELLEKLTREYAELIVMGLKSNRPDTRYYIFHALWKSPNPKAVTFLAEYLLTEMPDLYREVGQKALMA